MQRFEFKAGSSSKFWEVDVKGVAMTASWGRIGTTGQTKTTKFATAAAAAAAAAKLVTEKTKKGYVLTAGDAPVREDLLDYKAAVAFLKKRGVYKHVSKGGWVSGFHAHALVLPGGTKLGSLRLDHGELIDGKKSEIVDDGIIVDGNLTVAKTIQNGEQDFGPFLIVLGDLDIGNAAVAGAPIWVMGNLRVRGAFHGYYNHGHCNVYGSVDAKLLIADDYSMKLAATVKGKVIDQGYVKAKKLPKVAIDKALAKAYYELDGEGDDVEVRLASGKIYDALVKNKSIAK